MFFGIDFNIIHTSAIYQFQIMDDASKKLLDYVRYEEAQKVFDIIKTVYWGEKSPSDLKNYPITELIEKGMLAPIQQTLSLLESVCENKGLTVVLAKEIYEDTAIDEEPRILERQIVDCIETDERF